MNTLIHCPRCKSQDLVIQTRWQYLKWFGVGLVLSIFCVLLMVQNVAFWLSTAGMCIFLLITLVSWANFITHERNRVTCRNCGNTFLLK